MKNGVYFFTSAVTFASALNISAYSVGAVSDSSHTDVLIARAVTVIIFTVLLTRAELPAP